MISEGSCDTEEWRNNWSNVTTKINKILEYIKTENRYFWFVLIFHNITVFILLFWPWWGYDASFKTFERSRTIHFSSLVSLNNIFELGWNFCNIIMFQNV